MRSICCSEANFNSCRFKTLAEPVVPERFFDDYAPPVVVCFSHEARVRQPFNHIREETWRVAM